MNLPFTISDQVKGALYVAGAVVVAIVFGWVGWKLFFADHQAQIKAEQAHVQAVKKVGDAMSQAGAKAANTVAGSATKETIIHETTRDHYVEIQKQPGADDPVSDPLFDAFTRSVCMRDSAAGLPDCQRLQKVDPR